MLTYIITSELLDYNQSIARHKLSKKPVLIINHDEQWISCYFKQYSPRHNWSNFVIDALKHNLEKIGLRPHLKDGKLYLYSKLVASYNVDTDKVSTEGKLIIKPLVDYGINNTEIINLIVDTTYYYVEGRS